MNIREFKVLVERLNDIDRKASAPGARKARADLSDACHRIRVEASSSLDLSQALMFRADTVIKHITGLS